MFEKVSQMAEPLATSASRRNFLGRIGRGALVAAGAVGGFLAFGSEAGAGQRKRNCTSDAGCPRGYICNGGQCVKGVRNQACGAGSDNYCAGLVAGAYCQIGTTAGTCVGAPVCTCVPVGGGRGGGRRTI
jgi:hypothetical protein